MSYTIDPRVYELFTRLTPQEQADFLRDMLKIEEDFEPSDDKRFDNADGVVYE